MKKIDVKWIGIGVFFFCLLITLFYFFYNIIPHKIDIDRVDIYDNSSVFYSIEQFEERKSDNILIKGWIINKNEDNIAVDIKILCKNINTGNVYEIKTFSDKRNDVTNKINDGNNYDFSGFNSKIVRFMLPEKGKYKVIILFKQRNKDKNLKNFIVETSYNFYKN